MATGEGPGEGRQPTALPPWVNTHAEGATLAVKVQPRARANGLDGAHGAELKVKVTAPPVDSAANEALVEFLADRLGCPRRCVEIARGHKSAHKVVRLHGLLAEQVAERLQAG